MKIVTINIPDQYLDCIESIVNLGFMPSRSEVVREALKQFLIRESKINNGINSQNFEQMKRTQMQILTGNRK